MNVIESWLALIGTPERAKKLRNRLDSLRVPVLDPDFGPEPIQCPTTVLFGAVISQRLYADPTYRPALDAWDTQAYDINDLRRWCFEVERNYRGVIVDPLSVASF